ncbi:MAG: hypothetical protein M5U27_09955 [Gaiella sp.]|nr:hypothetical protein [Gaiella sp.]
MPRSCARSGFSSVQVFPPTTTITGDAALAAVVIKVSAFVNPGPLVTNATPSLPDTRAYPSAIPTAWFSWRAATYPMPMRSSSMSSFATSSPIRPNTRSTPDRRSSSAIAS